MNINEVLDQLICLLETTYNIMDLLVRIDAFESIKQTGTKNI